MKKLLFLLFLFPVFAFGQTRPLVPLWQGDPTKDSIGYTIPPAVGIKYLGDTKIMLKISDSIVRYVTHTALKDTIKAHLAVPGNGISFAGDTVKLSAPTIGTGNFVVFDKTTGAAKHDTTSYLPYYTASGYRVIKGLPLKIYPQVSLYNTPTYPTKWPDSLLVKNGKVINAYPYWNIYNHSDTLTKNIDIDDNGHQLQIEHTDGSTGASLAVIGATEVTTTASNISSGAQGTVDVQIGSVAITGTGGFGNQAQQIVNNSGALTSFQDNSLGFPTNSQLSLSDSVLMEYTYQDEFSATKNKGIGLNPNMPGLTIIDDTKIGMTNNSNDFTPTDSTYTTKHYNDLHYATAGSGVSSFNTRTGAVTLSSGDVTTALGFTPVTNARTLTINGTALDLSANRSWSVGTVTSVSGTTNRVTSTGGATPVIDISSTFEALLEKVANKTAIASTSTTTYPNWLGVENYVASQIPSTPSLQSVATVGNSYTGQIQAQSLYASGTGGNGYIDIPIQSTSPASTTNRLKIYADSVNRLSWKNSIYRRTIQVPYPSDYTIRMPYRVTGTTLEDSSFTAATYALKFAGTGYSKYASGTLSYITAIPNADLANSSTTINGTSIALGASGTVTAAAGTLTGTSLATNVVNSSLTNVGILTGLTVTGNVFANGSTASSVTINTTSLNNTHGQNFAGFIGNTANASSTQDQMIAVGGVIYSGSGTHLGLTRSYEGAYFDQGGTDTVHYEFDAVKPVMTSGTIIKHAYFHTATDAGAISGVTTNYAILSESGSPSSFGGTTTFNGSPSTISNSVSIISSGYNLGTNSTTPVGGYGAHLYNENPNFTGNARMWLETNAYLGNSFLLAYGNANNVTPTLTSVGALGANTNAALIIDRTGAFTIPQLSSTGIVHNSSAGLLSTSLIVNADITASTIDLTSKVTGILPSANGGTGVNNASTITLGGNLTTSGAFTTTLTETGTTSVTLPTSGTLVSSVTTANGVSASNTAGALTFTLGAITPTTVVANSGAWNGSLANNLYIGTATGITHQTNALVLVDGATGMGTRAVVSGTAGSNTANDAYGGLFITGQTVTIPTGTAPLVAPLIVKNPTVTATGTITDLATAYFQGGNSAGAANWNIWGKYGVSRFSGIQVDTLTASQLIQTDANKRLSSTTALPSGTTATTQTSSDNSTKVATTAYVDAVKPIHGNSTTTGTATTAVTVTIGSTMGNTTYNVSITPRDLLTAVNYYISAQSTTTFTVTFVSALTGSINFDYNINP